jgi:16S rRNA (guanine(966)-N(2))-methyltransferase RsmD
MLRITGGIFGGRKVHLPPETNRPGEGTRPSQAKLRQALYNSLQMDVPEARVLDLYAGGGTLGFEALSRGAASVVFFESAKPAVKVIERNARELEVLDRVRIHAERVEKAGSVLMAIAESEGLFDVVVADPPYALGVELDLVGGKWWSWDRVLAPGGKLVIEWGRTKSQFTELPEEAPFLVKVREKTYGDSILTTYQRPES